MFVVATKAPPPAPSEQIPPLVLPPLDQGKRLPVVVTSSLPQSKIAWELSEQQLEIVKAQANLDVRVAEHEVGLAEAELNKYQDKLSDLRDKVNLATTEYERWIDRVAWTQRMVKKGYLSRSQGESEDHAMRSSKARLDELKRQLTALETVVKQRNELDLRNRLDKAKSVLAAAKVQSEARIAQAEADRNYKLSEYQKRLKLQKELDE